MHTPKFFDIFVSSSGSLHLRLTKLRKFSKLQLVVKHLNFIKLYFLQLQFRKFV